MYAIRSYYGLENESEAISRRDAIVMFQNIRMGFDYTISSKTTFSVLTVITSYSIHYTKLYELLLLIDHRKQQIFHGLQKCEFLQTEDGIPSLW